MSPAPLLYLTQDGLLEPLSQSQVVRVVEALGRRGWAYRVLSLEKERDLADTRKVRALERRLENAGVRWEWQPFDWSQSVTAAASNLGRLAARAVALARAGRVSGLHARAYVPAVAALAAWNATGLPWVFDARSYWIDERLEEGRWFTSPIRLAVARGLEHQLFASASGVVTLTELQASDVRARFPALGPRPVACITTLADYDDFRPRRSSELDRIPAEVRLQLEGKNVVAIIGSINRSYLVDETIDLAARILARDSNAHLLVLSAQREEYERRLAAAGVALHRVTVSRAEHDAMPQWLALVRWCLLLLNPSSPAKRASMPTKLAELFAAHVRPVQFGCNEEVSSWVRRAGSGLVLSSVDPASLDEAAHFVASDVANATLLQRARRATREHFSLESGIAKYDALLREVFRR